MNNKTDPRRQKVQQIVKNACDQLNQEGVDATHIRLLEGELPDQFKLMRLVGRLRVEVLKDE